MNIKLSFWDKDFPQASSIYIKIEKNCNFHQQSGICIFVNTEDLFFHHIYLFNYLLTYLLQAVCFAHVDFFWTQTRCAKIFLMGRMCQFWEVPFGVFHCSNFFEMCCWHQIQNRIEYIIIFKEKIKFLTFNIFWKKGCSISD